MHPYGVASAPERLLGLGLRQNFDYVDADLARYRGTVLDLLRIDFLRGRDRVDLVSGDIAPPVGGADALRHDRVLQVERPRIGARSRPHFPWQICLFRLVLVLVASSLP